MDLDMYVHPTTKRNLEIITGDGVHIIPAESGELASGLVGQGRMAEPETLFNTIQNFFESSLEWKGKKFLITAGPTYEALDPVRFIGNHSSGKMGFEIAKNLLRKGAEVVLISGPTKLTIEHPNLTLVKIQTAEQMLGNVQKYWLEMDVGIFSAAVADYRPLNVEEQKIKKSDDHLVIELVKNPDILAWAGSTKKVNQCLVGFALETTNGVQYAQDKLSRKNLDFIVLNSLEDHGAGFGHDTNKISILDNHNNFTSFELMSKVNVAEDIVKYLKNYL
jgi:phosphopantothenoylcysteine decarboxylase/phosphopantothenate--cysteine ligase